MKTTTRALAVIMLCLVPTATLRAQAANPPALPPDPSEVYRADLKAIHQWEEESKAESERTAARWWWFRTIVLYGALPAAAGAGIAAEAVRRAGRCKREQST
jgi:hypothetical protein